VTEYSKRPIRLGNGRRGGRWLEVAAVATWLVCGLPALASIAAGRAGLWPGAVFVAAFAVYGAALLALFYLPDGDGRRRIVPIALLGIESVTGMTMVYVSGHYLGGTGATTATIVIVAAQAPYILGAAAVWILVAIQTVVTSLLFVREAPFTELVSLALAIGGFQVFATASSLLALREAAARAILARTNAELQATRAMLAESSRAEERLRISRDLHDTLGHHLTALSLQLDVASRIAEGKAADHVRQAHAITRLLLSDVRDVVSALRETNVDLAGVIRTIADSPSGIAIHLDIPPVLTVHDTERAQTVLRCVQEVITNATRHAQARNLWIRIDTRTDGIALHARDDGHGAPQLSLGHGLIGMRERFAAHAGSVEFESRPDRGFEVRGFLPTPHPVA
jgi:signal transduction histidine kinase